MSRRWGIVLVAALAVVAVSVVGYQQRWYHRWQAGSSARRAPSANDRANDDHAGHDHAAGADALVLSEQARKNLGLQVGRVTFSDYWRTLTIPAVVTEQPGHSERRISSAMHGLITRVYIRPGQTVHPGDPLFDVQPTGEILLSAQSNLLKTLQDLELVEAEITRLKPLAEQGAVPSTRLLEKQYERQRLDSQRLVQRQELMARGLTAEQVEQIVRSKILVKQVTISVPDAVHGDEANLVRKTAATVRPASLQETPGEIVYSVEQIDVFPGKLVQPGDELCDLAHHTELYLAGLAFQRDAELVGEMIEHQRAIRAEFESTASDPLVRSDLRVRYSDNVIDPETGTFQFYIPLTNEVARDIVGANGVTYRSWRFKPGQRAQLEIPVEHWTGRIVLPADAVVQEAAEAYVFREIGDEFNRVSVHLEYENGRVAVLANDGQLFIGDRIAMNQAYQLNLALKKQQGSGVDVHAGHNH